MFSERILFVQLEQIRELGGKLCPACIDSVDLKPAGFSPLAFFAARLA